MITINKELFFKLQDKFKNVPFNQTEEWLDSHYAFSNVIYFVDNNDQPEICCWGVVFERKFIGLHLIIEGITIKSNDPTILKCFFKDIIELGYAIIELSDISWYNSNFEIGIRQAGFIRPLGLSLCPMTMVVDLQKPFSFHRNWRRNVKKANEKEITFKIVDNPTISESQIFIDLFCQLKDRKKLNFSLDSKALLNLFQKKRFMIFFAQEKNGVFLAGRVIYLADNAYDVYAANSDKGLECGAIYFLQEKILYYLKSLNMNLFDYGRISPSADHMNNIYVSKSYSGGRPLQYNGQWQYSKSKKIVFLYSFRKFYLSNQRLF